MYFWAAFSFDQADSLLLICVRPRLCVCIRACGVCVCVRAQELCEAAVAQAEIFDYARSTVEDQMTDDGHRVIGMAEGESLKDHLQGVSVLCLASHSARDVDLRS